MAPTTSEKGIANGSITSEELATVEGNHTLETEIPLAENTPTPSDIPNGGFKAWLQVAGAFCLFLNTWGVANIFGVFQAYYELNTDWHRSSSDISWIGSLQSALLFLGCAVVGPFFDMGYLRTLLGLGTLLVSFGLMMTSLCTNYWQTILAQGVTVGLGMACLFLPSITIVAQYFTTKKAFAFGIAALGTSIGGVVYQILFRELLPRIGFPWTVRVIGFVVLVTMSVPLFGMKQNKPPKKNRGEFFDWSVLKHAPYTVYCIGIFFGFAAVYTPLFYVELYALEQTDTNRNLASYLVAITIASGIPGRLIPNYLADKFGPLNVQVPLAIICSVMCFGWMAVSTEAGMVTFSVLYGIFSGGFSALPGITVVTLLPRFDTVGVSVGMALGIAGCGSLVGSPAAGAVLESDAGWRGLQAFSAVLLLVSAALMGFARVLKVSTSLGVKA